MDDTHDWFLLPEILTCELPQWCTWNASMSLSATCKHLLHVIRNGFNMLPHCIEKHGPLNNILGLFPGLTELDLSESNPVDDQVLARLTTIRELTVHTLTTDAGIASLSSLTRLSMYENSRISDASLCQLPNLTFLWLGYGLSTDISYRGLWNLTHLTCLESGSVFVSDTLLARFSKLERLDLGTNGDAISDASITTLTRLTMLDTLNAHMDCRISVHGLCALTNLEVLIFGQQHFARGLVSLPHLEHLEVYMDSDWHDDHLLSIAKLTGLSSLEVNLQGCEVHDATLASLTACTALSLDDGYHSHFTNAAIVHLTRLERINLGVTHRIDSGGLKNLTGLTILDLGFNLRVTNDALSRLTNLTRLSMDGAAPISLDCILGLPRLQSLRFNGNKHPRLRRELLARNPRLRREILAYHPLDIVDTSRVPF